MRKGLYQCRRTVVTDLQIILERSDMQVVPNSYVRHLALENS